MYRWYEESAECYVYLEDYRPWDPSSFAACEWFRRGWTLQELLAPRHCVFFAADWHVIGHKDFYGSSKPTSSEYGPHLLEQRVAATKIPGHMLTSITEISTASVARRMSWASHRSTTRVEDRAYSLLGIFDINMPKLSVACRKRLSGPATTLPSLPLAGTSCSPWKNLCTSGHN